MEDMYVISKNEEIAKSLAQVINDKQGENTAILDFRQHEQIAEFYVITTAANQPHLMALLDAIDISMKKNFGILQYHPPHNLSASRGVSPQNSGGWVVMDYQSIVIHLMSEQQREFYALEKLWFDVPRIAVDHDEV